MELTETGRVVYERTYSRPKPDGTKEDWPETVERVVDGNLALVPKKYHLEGEREALIKLITEFKIIPGGRHLWASGVKGRQYLFNCHVSGWGEKLSDHFEFTFMRLMEGGGVGSNYSNSYLDRYPPLVGGPYNVHIVCDPGHPDYLKLEAAGVLSKEYTSEWEGAFDIEDSREGWASALVDLVDTYGRQAKNQNRVYDVSRVREEGARLKTFGGRASGPLPLAKMLIEISEILNVAHARADYPTLTGADAMMIDHAIAKCVVSGGVRRSARMAMMHWSDPQINWFLKCKANGDHWTTNISVILDDEFFKQLSSIYEDFPEGVEAGSFQATDVLKSLAEGMLHNGEPGFWNYSLSQEGEPNEVICTNPCGEITLEAWENCFDGDETIITSSGVQPLKDLVGVRTQVWANGGWHNATGKSFGVQPTQRVTFAPARESTGTGFQKTRAGFRRSVVVTPDHRWFTYKGETTSLKVGDVIGSEAVDYKDSDEFTYGFTHGVVFGDGSFSRIDKDGVKTFRVRLFGKKKDLLDRMKVDNVTYPDKAGCPEAWIKSYDCLKTMPHPGKSAAYTAGFMAGWIATDGSIRKNGSVHLSFTGDWGWNWLQEHAAQYGWVVRAHTKSTKSTNYGPRKESLHLVTLDRGGAWVVESIEPTSDREVFCVTVPGVEQFTLSSGLQTSNCNLGHVNLAAFVYHQPELKSEATGMMVEGKPRIDSGAVADAHKYMTRFLIRATYGDVTDPKQSEVLLRNRRVGVGHLGVASALAMLGIKYSEATNSDFWQFLTEWAEAVDDEAEHYCHQLRIPIPVKKRTVAPTGTIAKMPGVSEGIHPIFAKYFDRRIRFSMLDPEQWETCMDYANRGYHVEPSLVEENTMIVTIPTKDILMEQVENMGLDPDVIVESAADLTLGQMLAFQEMYQCFWADNAVSFTANINPDDYTVEDIMDHIKYYGPLLKGATIFPEKSFQQAPYTRITKEEYEAASAKNVDASVDDECATGACPVR